MYQLNITVDKEHESWYKSIEKVLKIQVKEINGVIANRTIGTRLEISIACENSFKAKAKTIVKKTLSELYLTLVKYEYLEGKVKITGLPKDSFSILIHTLVAFDREAEEEILRSILSIEYNFALDGFFNFRLGELKQRWNDIAQLASNNAIYLGNEETLNELLKFLMSAVTPKIQKIVVSVLADHFNVTGRYKNSKFEFRIFSPEQLLIYLINVAPLELTLEGEFEDKRLYNRIVSIFDGKSG